MNHLNVRLGVTPVGDLRLRSGDSWEFRFRPEYVALYPRPILGQFFEDDLLRVHRTTLRLPPFFSNLLPEGPLRQLIARQAHVNEQREALLLAKLGGDLPGAIVVEQGDNGDLEAPADLAESASSPDEGEPRWKFSLAGVQLKFSVLRDGHRLTLPVSGQGGDWIAKLPDAQYPGVPANELSMLQWARQAGIEVPDHELIPISRIDGLPQEMRFAEADALAIRRFDRDGARRIHQEDFAQIIGLFPQEKYDRYNYETIGNVIHAVAGPDALVEYARRLTFVVLSGNGDAHHKNWSLLYSDGFHASLSPAYDLVFTKAYIADDELALKLRKTRDFAAVNLESFRRLARKCSFDENSLAEAVQAAAERIRRTWTEIDSDLPLAPESKAKLRVHLDSIRL